MPTIRDARPDELEPLARLWYDAWQDAHAGILPAELVRIRTLDNLRGRLADMLGKVRVAEAEDALLGFALVLDDELYQLFVAARARGKGVADALIGDAEARMRRAGTATAWLDCAIGNARAARFYEKRGWRHVGEVTSHLPVPGGTFELRVWRYHKDLREPG